MLKQLIEQKVLHAKIHKSMKQKTLFYITFLIRFHASIIAFCSEELQYYSTLDKAAPFSHVTFYMILLKSITLNYALVKSEMANAI